MVYPLDKIEDDIAFSEIEINQLAEKNRPEYTPPNTFLFFIFEINDDEIKFLITPGCTVNNKDIQKSVKNAHKTVYGENCRTVSHFPICSYTKKLIETIYGPLTSKYIVSKNEILNTFNKVESEIIQGIRGIPEARDDQMMNDDDDDNESIQSNSFEVDTVEYFLVDILSKFIENAESNFKFIRNFMPKEPEIVNNTPASNKLKFNIFQSELPKKVSYFGKNDIVAPTEKPFFGEIGFDYFSFSECKGIDNSSLGSEIYISDKDKEDEAKEKQDDDNKPKIKNFWCSPFEQVEKFNVYYNKINKNIFTISSSLVQDINFSVYFPEFDYQTTLPEEKKNILNTFLPSYKDFTEEDVIRAINSINENINYSEKHIINLIKKVIQLNYKIIKEPPTGRIKHKIKSSILFQQVSKLCFIRSKEHEKLLRHNLSDILVELGLEKKRYNDGFYWYRIKPRFKSTFLQALNSAAYRTFGLNNDLINYYRRVYMINGQLYQDELDAIFKEMNAIPHLEVHRPEVVEELKSYETKKKLFIQSFSTPQLDINQQRMVIEPVKLNPGDIAVTPWRQSSESFNTFAFNKDKMGCFRNQTEYPKFPSPLLETQNKAHKTDISCWVPGKPTEETKGKSERQEMLDNAATQEDNDNLWNESTRNKVSLKNYESWVDESLNKKLEKLENSRKALLNCNPPRPTTRFDD